MDNVSKMFVKKIGSPDLVLWTAHQEVQVQAMPGHCLVFLGVDR